MLRRMRQVLLLTGVMGLLAGCSQVYDTFDSRLVGYQSESTYNSGSLDYGQDQAITYSATARVETKTYEETLEELQTLISHYQGRVDSQSSSNSSDSYTGQKLNGLAITISLPSDQVDSFAQDLKEDFHVRDYSFSSHDAAPDLEANQDRQGEIQARVADIDQSLEEDDNLSPEERTLLREEREALMAEAQSLNREATQTQEEVDYSLINLSLEEVVRYWDEPVTLGHRLRYSFTGFLDYASSALVASLISLFFVFPYIIVGVITYLVTRKLTNRWIHGNKKDSLNK